MKTLLKSFILILAFLSSSVICQVDYSTEIQPIFNSNCTVCHGGSGGLFLSSYTGLMTGGNSGQVLIAGDGTNSLIIQKLRGTAQGSQMPMGGNPLEESVISLLETWINEGANETPLSTKHEKEIHPNQISIIQNYPNPFNPITHFQIFS
ncbi:MAG: c-type cytochrome domain-containing protein, partial [Candidatus Marinimicrobia bacterium]|nr:c-type cytochrome domain-containing protein [Candidatus Neomarinimicrobiota bacterium]